MIQVPREVLESLDQQTPALPSLISAPVTVPAHEVEGLRNITDPGSGNSNTEKTTRWSVNAYNNWRSARRNIGNGTDIIPELGEGSIEELNYWLSQFIEECRQRDGRDYKHQNIYAMVCGLSRHIKKIRPNFNILDDPGMKDFKASLYGVMKRLQTKQAHLYSVQVSKLSRKHWDYLWDQGFLGDSNPTSLFYAVYFLFITVTGATSALQLRSMTTRNIIVSSERGSNKIVTTFYPLNKSDRAAIRCTETDVSQPRSFGRLLQLYLSKLPALFPDLWLRPSPHVGDVEWYSRQPIGQNILRTTVKSVCQLSNFVGHYSNQSLGRDLLNWEHYDIEHLMMESSPGGEGSQSDQVMEVPAATPAGVLSDDTRRVEVSVLQAGVKREFLEDNIPYVTVNTRLSPSKRFRSSEPLTDQACSVPLTDQACSVPLTDQACSSAASSPAPIFSGTPSTNYYPDLPLPNTFTPSRHATTTRYSSRDVTSSGEENMPSVPPASTSKDSKYQYPSVPPTSKDSNYPRTTENIRFGQEVRDVNVDIPEHINRCLGLFKDCTIQNVTINIYLNKDRIDEEQ